MLTMLKNDEKRNGGRQFVEEVLATLLDYWCGRAPVGLLVNWQWHRGSGKVLRLLGSTWLENWRWRVAVACNGDDGGVIGGKGEKRNQGCTIYSGKGSTGRRCTRVIGE